MTEKLVGFPIHFRRVLEPIVDAHDDDGRLLEEYLPEGFSDTLAALGDLAFEDAPLDPTLGGLGTTSVAAARNLLAGGSDTVGDLVQLGDAGGGSPQYPAADGSLITGIGGGLSAVDFANGIITVTTGVTLSASHLAFIAGESDLDIITVVLRHASNQATAVTVLVPNNIGANSRIRFAQATDQSGDCFIKPETTASTINGDDGDPSGGIKLAGAGAQAELWVASANGSAFTAYLAGLTDEARTVKGATTFSAALTASSTLAVTGAITATGGIDCNDPATFDDNVTLDGSSKALIGGGNTQYGFAVTLTSVSGALDSTHIGRRLTTSGSVTVPTTPTGWWAVIVLGNAAHDITFDGATTDVSALGWGAGDRVFVEVTSSTTASAIRTAAADITAL
jgi:hypothetical protein